MSSHRSAFLAAAATIWSPQVIADELNLPLAEVEATLAETAGYGTAPYGLGAYGRCKAVAEGDAEVIRRVSLTGQMTYRRQTYCLGRANRGRMAWVREVGSRLMVRVGVQTMDLAIRHRT